jgi:hypothetical protein
VAGLALIVAAVALSPARAKTIAQAPVAITVDRTAAGVALPADFSGFSYEVKVLLPGADGVRYFRADNPRLLALFRTLGIGSLRIGGNTSDRDARELPKQADLDSLFAFAQAANVKVIYCLRLRNGDATAATATVKYIMDHYAPLVDSFSIGQEPSAYPVEKVDTRPAGERMGAAVEKFPYASYRDQWKTFADAIIAAVPNVRFCGPSVHNNGTWARRFIADFGTGHHVALVTEHLYAGGAGQKLASAEIGRDRMLSDDFTRAYQKLYDSFVPDAKAAGLPFRLEEANSYFNGGALGASNTYSSALWGLDFMFWWAAHGAAGLNFHTGDRVSMNNDFQAPRYAAFVSKADGFEVRPLAYAIKAYNLGARGRIVPVNVTNPANLNVTAYAAIAPDGAVFLTIINREHGAEAQEATVVLNGFNANAPARALWLRQEASDVAATTGVTLGGAPITSAGAWKGNWEPLASGTESRSVKIPAASAVIVELK